MATRTGDFPASKNPNTITRPTVANAIAFPAIESDRQEEKLMRMTRVGIAFS